TPNRTRTPSGTSSPPWTTSGPRDRSVNPPLSTGDGRQPPLDALFTGVTFAHERYPRFASLLFLGQETSAGSTPPSGPQTPCCAHKGEVYVRSVSTSREHRDGPTPCRQRRPGHRWGTDRGARLQRWAPRPPRAPSPPTSSRPQENPMRERASHTR